MARRALLASFGVPLLALAGCGSDYEGRGWIPPRPLGGELAGAIGPTTLPATSPTAGEPQGVVTLRQALVAALRHSPELSSFAYSVRSAEADVLQASVLPNPELGVEVENFGGSGSVSGFDAAESTVSLSQLVELGGKRSKRTRAAQLSTDLAGWDYETKRMDVLTDVAKRFLDVAAGQRRVELALQNAELSEKVFSTVTQRVQAGKVPPVEQTKARVLLMINRTALHRSRGQLASARQQLAATWGSDKAAFDSVVADMDHLAAVPAREALLARVTQNPDLARWTTEVARRRADIAVAKSRSIPDVTIGAGVRKFSESGDTGGVVGVSMPIPLFDQNQGEIRKSKMEMLKALADQQAAQTRVHAAFEEAYQTLSTAHDTAMSYRSEVVPGAEESFTITNVSYSEGKLRYLDVLDAQRTLYEARAQYTDALVEYHKAVADVERLVGEQLDGQSVVETKASTQEAATQPSQEK